MKFDRFSPAAALAGAILLAAACGPSMIQPEVAPVPAFPLIEAARMTFSGSAIPQISVGPEGLVLLATKTGVLQAVDPEKTGKDILRWTYAGAVTVSAPVVSGDRIVWAAADGRIVGINKAGLEIWTKKLNAPVRGELRIVGGLVIFLEGESFLSALNPADGEISWRIPVVSPLDWTVADDRIVLRTTTNRLYVFRPDGRLAREYPVEGTMGGDFGVYEKTAFIGSSDGRLAAYDLMTGKKRWSIRVGGVPVGSPVFAGRTTYVVLSNQIAAAFKSGRGDFLWWKPLAGRAAFPPGLIGEYVFFSSRSPQLRVISLKSFEVKVAFEAGREILAPPVATESKICLVTLGEAEGEINLIILNRFPPAPPVTPQVTDPLIIKK